MLIEVLPPEYAPQAAEVHLLIIEGRVRLHRVITLMTLTVVLVTTLRLCVHPPQEVLPVSLRAVARALPAVIRRVEVPAVRPVPVVEVEEVPEEDN